jgi:hypothetical protein
LIKLQWGEILSKFKDMPMAGGVKFNGQQIKNEALAEIKDLKYELINSWGLLESDIIGPS